MSLSVFTLFLSNAQANEPVDVGFRLMMRPMVLFNSDFNSDTTDDASWGVEQSVRLRAKGTWDGVIVNVALNDGRVWGSEASYSLAKEVNTALYEGYFQVGTIDNKSSWLRIGRQEFVLHEGRHFHKAGWSIHGRTFDAIRYHGEKGKYSWDLTGMVWTQADSYETTCTDVDADDGIDDCADFTAEMINSVGDVVLIANAEAKLSDALVIQPYVITLRQDANADDLDRDRLVISPSLRLEGKPTKELSYSLEGVYQVGRASADVEHSAWMAAAKVSYNNNKMGTSAWYEENSGDGDATDDVDNNYEPFYGAFHKYRGFADYVGPINSRDIGLGVSMKLPNNLSAKTDLHYFQLSDPMGTWYSFNRKPIGSVLTDANEDSTIGQEVDLVLTYKPTKGVKFNMGYSLFMPAGAGASIVGDDPSHFAYLWMIVKK